MGFATGAAAQGTAAGTSWAVPREWLEAWGLASPEPSVTNIDPESPGSWHEKQSTELEPSQESWIGGDGFRRVVSMYTGVTWSPFGNLRQDGLRARLVGGQSFYRYAGNRYDPDIDRSQVVNFVGDGLFVDALVGWQFSAGATTLKVFGGWSWANNRIGPYDVATRIQGIGRGPKGALEVWHNWSPKLWTSMDLSASRVHLFYALQARVGWRVDGTWSVGPEASVTGHEEGASRRGGVFVRFDDSSDEITISGGATQARGVRVAPSGYGTAQWLRRF